MIWIKIKVLEDKIAKNQLTERDGFNYLLLTIILGILGILIPTLNGFNYVSIIHVLLSITVTVIGLQKLYKINSLIDDKEFIKRFISITWVVRIRLIVYYLIFTFIYIQFLSEDLTKRIAVIVISVTMNILFYYYSIKSFKRLKLLIAQRMNL